MATNTLNDGLIGYWKFDEGTGVLAADSSGFGNNGDLTGHAPTWSSTVPSLQFTDTNSLSFSSAGDTYVAVPYNSSLDITSSSLINEVTVCAWARPASWPTNGNYSTILARDFQVGSYGSPYFLAYYRDSSGVLYLRHGRISSTASTRSVSWAVTGINLDEYHHICGVTDGNLGNNFRLYVDGYEVAATADGVATQASNSPLRIGQFYQNGSGVGKFDGILDEVRVYNRTLLADEIRQLARGYNTFSRSLANYGLRFHFKFDETNPKESVIDSSGNLNHGALTPTRTSNSNANYPTDASAPLINFGTYKRSFFFNGNTLTVTPHVAVLIPPAASINNLTNKTFSAWMKPDIAQTSYIGAKGTAWFLQIVTTDTTMTISSRQAGSTNNANSSTASLSIPLNTWTHVAFVYSDTTKKGLIYVNGTDVTDTSSALSGTYVADATGNLALGSNSANSAVRYTGLMDDARLYNRVLSAAEVATLATGAEGATDSALVGWYKFDEDYMASDSSGNGHSGVFTGTVSSTSSPIVKFNNPYALDFSSTTARVAIANSTLTQNLVNITLAGWVKVTGSLSEQTIIDKSTNTTSGWKLTVDGTGVLTATRYHTGTDAVSVSSTTITPGTWAHVLATFSNTTKVWRIYINGTEVSYTTQTAGSSATDNDAARGIGIGSLFNTNTATSQFTGGLDDVRIYNRILTASEIATLGAGYSPATQLFAGTFYGATIY